MDIVRVLQFLHRLAHFVIGLLSFNSDHFFELSGVELNGPFDGFVRRYGSSDFEVKFERTSLARNRGNANPAPLELSKLLTYKEA